MIIPSIVIVVLDKIIGGTGAGKKKGGATESS